MPWKLQVYKSFAAETRAISLPHTQAQGEENISVLKNCKKQLLSILLINYCNFAGWILQQTCFVGAGLTTACWDCAPKEETDKLDLYRAVT